MLDEASLDAVAIATLPSQQPDIAEYALRKGIAVFAEKPLAATVEQARELEHIARASGLPNVVDFMFPELETWEMAKRLLDDGAVGKLRHVAVDWRMESYSHRKRIMNWKTDASKGGGVLQHFGCHTLHYLEHLFGPIAELSATLASAEDLGARADTLAALSLRFHSGLSGAVFLCSAATQTSVHRVEAYGSDGSLVLANPTTDPVSGFEIKMASRQSPGYAAVAVETIERNPDEDTRVAPVSRVVSRFLDWCIDGMPTTPAFRDGLRVQELIATAHRSSAAKSAVPVTA